ncbi:MAG: hypothetical protein D4R43_01125 [Sphingobacteriales bacterium]|nr:MAG: hypothetical protein D4R43_01125 [Sphingobacteriales bacterium]
MIARILDSRLLDLILIILALRFIFPQYFNFKSLKPEKKPDRIIIVQKETQKEKKKPSEKACEYVDYEEVK